MKVKVRRLDVRVALQAPLGWGAARLLCGALIGDTGREGRDVDRRAEGEALQGAVDVDEKVRLVWLLLPARGAFDRCTEGVQRESLS